MDKGMCTKGERSSMRFHKAPDHVWVGVKEIILCACLLVLYHQHSYKIYW